MVVTHEVQSGETLESIARRFGTTTSEILRVNDIPDQRLRARMVIRIPILIIPPTVPSQRPYRNYHVRVVGNIMLVIATDRLLYQKNQPVRMELIKTNISSRPVTLTYNSPQRFDFIVRRGSGSIIWEWSYDWFFSGRQERVVLQPGASQIYRADWPQRSNEGDRVRPGVYTVHGENTAQEMRGRGASVSIRIV